MKVLQLFIIFAAAVVFMAGCESTTENIDTRVETATLEIGGAFTMKVSAGVYKLECRLKNDPIKYSGDLTQETVDLIMNQAKIVFDSAPEGIYYSGFDESRLIIKTADSSKTYVITHDNKFPEADERLNKLILKISGLTKW